MWTAASGAWLSMVALDADTAAGEMALLAAVENLYAAAPVRDVSLLPVPASQPPGSSAPRPHRSRPG